MQRKYLQMTNQQLIDFMNRGGALVDIRREDEWHLTGVVEQSILLTFYAADGSSDPNEWLAQLNRLVPPEQPLALICRSGYRTTFICDFLLEVTTRPEIHNLTNGILGWLAEQLPVVNFGDVA